MSRSYQAGPVNVWTGVKWRCNRTFFSPKCCSPVDPGKEIFSQTPQRIGTIWLLGLHRPNRAECANRRQSTCSILATMVVGLRELAN